MLRAQSRGIGTVSSKKLSEVVSVEEVVPSKDKGHAVSNISMLERATTHQSIDDISKSRRSLASSQYPHPQPHIDQQTK
jgi:hypothetical protein